MLHLGICQPSHFAGDGCQHGTELDALRRSSARNLYRKPLDMILIVRHFLNPLSLC